MRARWRCWRARWVAAGAARDDRERGNAIVEFCYLGILFLVPLVYIMLAVFDVQRTAYGVSAATRDAGRAFILAPSNAAGEARAREAARYALADQGLDLGDVDFLLRCEGGCGQPGSSVVVTISSAVSFPFLPDALGDIATIPVTSTHRTPYGEYRAGRG